MVTINLRLRTTLAFLVLLLVVVASAVLPLAAQAAGTTITEYGGLLAGAFPGTIAVGPDGALWFTEPGIDKIGRIDPVSHAVSEYGGLTAGSFPRSITPGPDGALWFTEFLGNRIGRIDATTHAVTEYGGLTAGSDPEGIACGPDGGIWFAEYSRSRIGRIDPNTHVVTEYGGLSATSRPYGITSGPDGALWFTEFSGNRVARMDPTTHAVTEYGGLTALSGPESITAGPDGALWFTEPGADQIGRFDPTSHTMTEYGGLTANSSPKAIASGSDGALWFTEIDGNRIGRIDPATRAVKEYAVPTAGSEPRGIAPGPDGALWFTEYQGNKVGRVAIPYPTWYLAEGTTAWGFSTSISIENTNASAVNARVTYMPTGAQAKTETIALPPDSQTTLSNDHLLGVLGGPVDFSTKVECTDTSRAIAVDRTMTWTGTGAPAPEAHASVGVTAPATTWYLPEGSSAWGFETWLLIQNPGYTTASAQVTYMIEGETPVTADHTIPARSRATFNMADDIGAKDASIKVVSNKPVIPERAMYKNERREGHDSIGTTTTARDYYLAEGTTAWGFTSYLLIQNPNATATGITVTYMTPSGAKPQAPFTMQANSRKTIRVNDVAGMGNTDFSTTVQGSKSIIAERAMYWNNGTGEACHDSIGMPFSHAAFYLPDGEAGGSVETWTLVQNPNSSPVSVDITYLPSGGTGKVTRHENVPARSRKTFNLAEHSGLQGRASIAVACTTAGKKIMVERAMYWNSRGAGTDTIGGFSD